MATIRCPRCGAAESDGRPCDKDTYEELCVPCERKQAPAAALAAMDYDETDAPSVAALGIDYRWPEPGEACMCELATAQLYWPALTPARRESA